MHDGLANKSLGDIWSAVRKICRDIWFLAFIGLYRRYCGSMLGLAWSLLNPIAQVATLSFAFGLVLAMPIHNYIVYLASGLLPWAFMATSVVGSTSSLTTRVHELNASTVATYVYVISDVTIEFLSFLIAYAVFLVIAVTVFQPVGWYLLYVPLAMLPIVLFTVGASLFFSYYSVHYRDLQHLLSVTLSVAFWAVPIVYHWSAAPLFLQDLLRYNPLALLIGPLQIVVHGRSLPSLDFLVASYAIGIVMLIMGLDAYKRLNRQIVYFL